jgi:N-acetylglucosaminyldiphosphoundecaprenol N-acetyl-beta-D-mannosaminyltransferase
MMKSVKIFGVMIDGIPMDELVATIKTSSKQIWIVTANPEILLYAKKDVSYRETLNRADLRIVDSFGLECVCRMKGMNASRIPGADLAFELVSIAAQHNESVAFIGGGRHRSAKPAFERLQARFSGLSGLAEDGGNISIDGKGDQENEVSRARIAAASPTILFVGFGHPKQERWIERYRHEFPSVRVFIGIGGTFDYWSGLIPRAPKWMRTIGLEWFYRLMKEPKRWRRIVNAVFVFPYHIFFDN